MIFSVRQVLRMRRALLALCAALVIPLAAWPQDSQSLVLRPRVVPPPVPEVQAACAACQPQADAYNRIARLINALEFQLAHRIREADLQRQAIALVQAEIASLQQSAPSATRDARMATARQRLEAYQAQLARDLTLVAELETQIAGAKVALAGAMAALLSCEEACANAAAQSSTQPPTNAQTGTPTQQTPTQQTPTQQTDAPASSTGSPPVRGRYDRWRSDEELQREADESKRLEETLKGMTGDQWGAELAAFFTSTLFDTDTPFDTAYGQNLQTLKRVTAPTPEQIAAQAELDRQNASVATQRAGERQAALDASGQFLENQYTREARTLIGPGYLGLASAGDSQTTAALMTQDAHMGQLLQFRANLNNIKIGDGTVSSGSFVNLTGAESFTRLTQINQELGFLRANDGDEERIAALEAERTQLLVIDGVASSDGLMNARTGLISGLAGLSGNVYEAYWNWIGFKEGGLPDKYGNIPVGEAQARYEAEAAQYETIYLKALGQSPFLGAMVDPAGTGDPIPLWQYLTSTESPWSGYEGGQWPSSYAFVASGARDPMVDQIALTQAIDFLDEATAGVIDQFGTIVTTVNLLDAYGSPVFAPLRAQVITELSPIYPQITANMALLTSQYDANQAAQAVSRIGTDLVVAGVQVVVGGIIFFFPFTAPVLVPVEIALTAGQVGLEGFRLYYAWQDLQRAEQAAGAGSGASYVGVKGYRDLFGAQVTSFVIVSALAPVSAGASLLSLDAANAQLRLAAAADNPGTATVVDAAAAAATSGAARAAPDFATFQAMRPADQVAAVKGLPEDVRSQLVSQLDRTGRRLFVTAWEKDIVDAKLIASVREGDLWNEQIGGNWQPLSDETRNLSDAEILDRIYRGRNDPQRLMISRDAMARYFDEVGDDVVGSSSLPLFDDMGEFPAIGHYTQNMTDAQIDALLAKTGNLTPEEIALKSDLLLRGYGRPLLEYRKNHTNLNLAEIQALFAKTGELTPEEIAIKADLVSRGWGRAKPGELDPLVVSKPALENWNAEAVVPANPVNPNPFNPNPFAAFGPAGDFDSGVATIGGAGDVAGAGAAGDVAGASGASMSGGSMSGSTIEIPGRPRNPNRTAIVDMDLPPENLIPEPVVLLDLPTDLQRLLQGDPVPNSFLNWAPPSALRDPKPFVFDTHPPLTQATGTTAPLAQATDATATIPLGTIVHFTPAPNATGAVNATTPPAWVPFATKVIPIGCRFAATSSVPVCDDTTYAFVLNYPASAALAMGQVLRGASGIAHVEGDVLRFVKAPDPYLASRGSWGQPYDDQWALKQIGLGTRPAAAGAADAGAAPVTVAVIDTGVAWNHVDLTSADLWVNPRELPANRKDDDGNGYVDDIVGWNFVDGNNLPWDFNGHGTLVAGVIAAGRDNGVGTAGVNPAARIMVLKAMDERGRGRASAIAEAIVYAARNGARVINLSVGGQQLTRTEELAIEFASAQGAIVVVAAGNEGIDLADYGPGGARRALTVTATDVSDRRLPATNFGAAIDLAAPGVDVLGPRAIGTDLLAAARVKGYRRGANIVGPDAGYIRATGTSFAAPLVAGVASLLFAAHPSLGAADVERILLQSARDIETPGVDRVSGYGRLDAAAALAADPRFFVEAAIDRVEVATTPGGPVARVIGTADAERFAGARIEIGKGETPAKWLPVEGALSAPVRAGTLREIPAAVFQGSAVWTLRLLTAHANGRTREARFLLKLN